ncbi:QueT transporter family protein [Streptococcaceae bacterium ESL0687]|nr:QueT transporter family protein [Streptococcaceae bacterium ESL0687]
MEYNKSSLLSFTKMALVTAMYVAITVVLGPLGSGAIQFRLSELFNFLAFYNKRYIYSVTLGCIISNWMVSGPVDAVVGSLSTFIFVSLGVKFFMPYMKDRIFKGLLNKAFFYFSIFFSLSMFTIALELKVLFELPFFFTWLTVGLGEFLSLIIGSIIIDAISKRIDLSE